MNDHYANGGSPGGRVQWGSYGFIAGIVLGVMLGWFFSGVVGAVVRLGLAALIVVPLILLFIGWRRYIAPWFRSPAQSSYTAQMGSIEVRGVVHDPRAR